MKIEPDHIISAVISAVILIGIVFFWFFFLRQTPLSDNRGSIPAATVNTQEYIDRLPILFVYDGYSDKKDALGTIALFKETLKIVEPYARMQDQIITKTFSTDGTYCTRQDISGKKRIKCADKVFNAISKLGILHYKTVILSPTDFASNSERARGENSTIYISTYKGKLTVGQFKRWMGIVFSQELGHSLGLSYEYAASKPSVFQEVGVASPPNCAPDITTAKIWWKDYNNKGYFKGCSGGDNYVYPEQNTLMSDEVIKQSYGIVSEDYLKGIISCFYGNKNSYTNSLGNKTCTDFKVNYPNL